MHGTRAFTPALGGNISLIVAMTAAASTTARTAISPTPVPNVYVYNQGSTTAWVIFGPSTVAAALSTGTPVPAGQTRVFGCSRQSYITAILSTGTGNLYVMPGEGGL